MHIPFNGKIVERYFFTEKTNMTDNTHEKDLSSWEPMFICIILAL
ncbi:hypothetical protein B4167_1360 [Caldibacillus thermoamylovorans]|uniref:Uncharacterized protein n=1 Tax=Caldibacillus thermoamylovorans TaxID=35841 RepID=A0ABD4ABS2_9BACI|nr:hypothetical protein B4167_1360 [Caldibacillus thermoamylovorans]